MMRFKNKGFSIIETMLALVVIGLVLSPLFVLQGIVSDRVTRAAQQFGQFLLAQQFLYEARRAQPVNARDFSLERRNERPPVQLQYMLRPVSETSIFGRVGHMCREQVTASAIERNGIKETIINVVCKPKVAS